MIPPEGSGGVFFGSSMGLPVRAALASLSVPCRATMKKQGQVSRLSSAIPLSSPPRRLPPP